MKLSPKLTAGAALAAILMLTAAGCPATDPVTTEASVPEILAPVFTFEEAITQCETTFPAGTDQSDCINAAIAEWNMYEPLEDEPGFDCRIHGNQTCGAEIQGAMYNVTFEAGLPVSVVAR